MDMYVCMLQGGMQEKRGSEVYVEGARELQHGDDIERGREWGGEECVGQGFQVSSVGPNAQKLGGLLAGQHGPSQSEPLLQAHFVRLQLSSLPQCCSFLLVLRPDLLFSLPVLLTS